MSATTDNLRNHTVYQRRDVVAFYERSAELQPPERTILEELRPRLGEMRMLDLGVGGGRTTMHFAPLVREYVGIDYSQAMVDACARRAASLGSRASQVKVVHGDARALGEIGTGFDLVLFSHNGIDYVEHDDRMRVLESVRSVLAPGGIFVFSTHNIASAGSLYSFRWPRLVRPVLVRLLNGAPSRFAALPHAAINDGAFGFRARTYYVRASEQIRRLETLGFEGIRTFALQGGNEIDPAAAEASVDPWLTYLCTAPRAAS